MPPHETAGRLAQTSLVDLLDRLLAGGVVIAGEITLAIADVDLVRINLLALLSTTHPVLTTVDGGPS